MVRMLENPPNHRNFKYFRKFFITPLSYLANLKLKVIDLGWQMSLNVEMVETKTWKV